MSSNRRTSARALLRHCYWYYYLWTHYYNWVKAKNYKTIENGYLSEKGDLASRRQAAKMVRPEDACGQTALQNYLMISSKISRTQWWIYKNYQNSTVEGCCNNGDYWICIIKILKWD